MRPMFFALILVVCASEASAQTPPPRFWHAAASNGATTPSASRTYIFGGSGGTQVNTQYFNDLWYYRLDTGTWTQPAISGKARPTKRGHHAWSCGNGKCVSAGGTTGTTYVSDTWVYSEGGSSWTQISCKKPTACPSMRYLATMAFDPIRGYHVHFGGWMNATTYNDTWTFSGTSWTKRAVSNPPALRYMASSLFVPSHVSNGTSVAVNKVVMFGGSPYPNQPYPNALCDLNAWNGTSWEPITSSNQGPCLMGASMGWDTSVAGKPRIIVASGFPQDGNNTPNNDTWYFTFTGPNSGSWSVASPSPCTPRAFAKAGFDVPTNKFVFFGGGDGTGWAYNDTYVCP